MKKTLSVMLALAFSLSLYAGDNLKKSKSEATPSISLPSYIENNSRNEEWILYMVDAYSWDSWNGASLDLTLNGTVVVDDATVNQGDNIEYFSVNEGDELATVWTSGQYDDECSYGIYDATGVLVAEAGTEAYPNLELSFTVAYGPRLILSGVLDLQLPSAGSDGKALMVTAIGDIADLSEYGVEVANNGNGSAGVTEFDFEAQTMSDGDVLFVVRSPEAYEAYFGAAVWATMNWVQANDDISQNGDDCILLYHNGVAYDAFGDPDVDGSGTDWEYVDAWAHRNCDSRTPTLDFNSGDWNIANPDCSEDSDTWATATCPFPYTDCAPIECTDTEYIITLGGGTYDNEASYEVVDVNGNVLSSGGGTITTDDGVTVCLVDGSYGVLMYDSYGDGWGSTTITFTDRDGNVALQGSLQTGSYGAGQLNVGDGEFANLLGCTDPNATNPTEGAIFDDGSCIFPGDICDEAIVAVAGANEALVAPAWFSYTAQVSGSVTVTSDGTEVDTYVTAYGGTCDALTFIANNDDIDLGEGNYASSMTFEVVTGTTYYIYWEDYWSSEGFVWELIEDPLPTTPWAMQALGGLGRVYLSFNPYNPANNAGATEGAVAAGNATLNVEQHIEAREAKMSVPRVENEAAWQGKTLEERMTRVAALDRPQHRDTDVYVTLYDSYGDGHNGDAYVMAIDASGTPDTTITVGSDAVGFNFIHTLAGDWTGYESSYGPFTLADGLHWVAWQEGASYLGEQSFIATDADGNQVGAGEYGTGTPNCFELGDTGDDCPAPAIADLTVMDADADGIADATYDAWSGRFKVMVKNVGTAPSNYFYTMVHSAFPDTTALYPGTYFQYSWTNPGLNAGEERELLMQYYLTVPGLTGGYDGEDYTFYVWVDSYGDYCVEPGGQYNNVATMPTINNLSPLAYSSWNIYRGDDGADATLLLNITDPYWQPGDILTHVDETATAEHTYCYTATQVNTDPDGSNAVESPHSGESCAYSSLPPDVPEPSNLAGSSSGFDVTLTWDPPAPYNGGASGLGLGTPSRTRQGGDTMEDATVITDLLGDGPFEGTTTGYTHDYSENCVGYGEDTSPDVVYKFTPAETGAYNMMTCYSSYDTKLYVYENEENNLASTTTGIPACSDDLYPPGIDDCTIFTSYIEGALLTAGNDYYIVVDGWSGNSVGDYILEIEAYDPLAGYSILDNAGSVVGTAPKGPYDEQVNWGTVLFAAEPTDLSLSVRADYLIPGILDPVYSDVVGPVTITVQLEDNPTSLMAMDYGDDVHLEWEPPLDASNMVLKYHDGIQGNATYYAGAAAVRFRVVGSWSMKGTAQGIWMDSWPDANYGDATWRITVVPPNADGLPDMTNILYDNEEVSVDADPTSETYGWAMTNIEPAIDVTGDVFVIYSGWYDWENATYNNEDGVFDLDMMQCDPTMDFPGSNYMIFENPFNTETYDQNNWQMGQVWSWCGDWQMNVHADFSGGGAMLGNWIGTNGLTDLDVPMANNVERANTKENPVEYTAPSTPGPWQAQIDRDMEGYNIYRADGDAEAAVVGMAGPDELSYWDEGLDWGTYTYHVTADYGADGESIPTNQVTLTLSNVAPNPVTIISPSDGLELDITPTNLDEEVAIIWTAASDDDNDALEYFMSLADPDTGIWAILPDNAVMNGSFEHYTELDNGWQRHADGWETYPDGDHYSVHLDGESVGFGGGEVATYDGGAAIRLWGNGSENNVFQTYWDGAVPPGTHWWADAMVLIPSGDAMDAEGNFVLFAKYFTADWGWIGMDSSMHVTPAHGMDEWMYVDVDGMVPEGTEIVQIGVMLTGAENTGNILVDDFYAHVPLTQTGLFLSYGDIAAVAIADSVNMMSIAWDIWAYDGFELTPSEGGARMLHLNISEELVGVGNGIALPTEFALHNNYPNPFNPVTNITYDIASATDVTLEIYNVMGQRVRTLAQGSHEPGRYRIMWNATNDYGQSLSSGMYIYRIQAGDFVSVKKLILMK